MAKVEEDEQYVLDNGSSLSRLVYWDVFFHRNFLSDPSILTRNSHTLMTMPVRSHLFGLEPVWFWILTVSVVLVVWCVHSIFLGGSCDDVLMPFLLDL